MESLGIHLIVEFHGCPKELLNDLDTVANVMVAAAEKANAKVLANVFKPFKPQGVSGVVVIAESHLSIHTWPEYGYAAVDFFTCGKSTDPYAAKDYLARHLHASHTEVLEVQRGALHRRPSYYLPETESLVRWA